MKTGTLGIVVGAVLALGAFATSAGASKSKPKLWLIDTIARTHATVGEAASMQITVSGCAAHQAASVSHNGKPVDQIAGSGALTAACGEGYKLFGTIKSVAVAPGAVGLVMTVSDLLHVGVEPWCTYTLPRKIAFPEFVLTERGAAITATLDKAASFGSCASTRAMVINLVLEQVSEAFPYEGELVG